jgi:hypothetical protein
MKGRSVPTQSAVDAIVDRLVGLAGEPSDDQYSRPLDLILDLWAADAELCQQVILKSVQSWEDCWLIRDDVKTAAREIHEPRYLELLDQCTRSRHIPRSAKLELLSLLIRNGFIGAASRFEQSFRRFVTDVQQGRAQGGTEVGSRVLEVCRLRLASLLPELEELRNTGSDGTGNRVHLDFVTKSLLDAAIIWFRDGASSLLAPIRDLTTRTQLRADCIFCLGCGGQEDYFHDFCAQYWKYNSRGDFPIQIACVESIVHSARIDDVLRFLNSALAHPDLLSTLKKRRFNANANLLLMGTYWTSRLDGPLTEATLQWLQARNKEIAAMAWLTLDRHGVDVTRYKTDLLGSINRQQQFLRDNPSFLGLMDTRANI